MTPEELEKAAVAAAEEAGRVIAGLRRTGVRYGRKPGYELVSEADLRAAQLLHDRLTAAFPAAGWLSEEHRDTGARLAREWVWVVDPLDGTREYLLGIPEFAVSVALVRGGEPVLGVVHNPATGETFATRSLARSAGENGRLRVLVGRGEAEAGEVPPLPRESELVGVGSIAYRLALLAAGHAEAVVTVQPRAEWDVAAGVALCRAAGLAVTDARGAALRFNKPRPAILGLVAAPVETHARLLRILRLTAP
ncbi:Fructose-1, 6-bisphosphatase/inositol-1-monophosphatase [bacterium HR29]|jgi:myo-inositol-1(or 4)-monophosphatase|nr:Fructose-1, 6-bisphosphatase/inositol-1-monophosphatase [bacterium HR29]